MRQRLELVSFSLCNYSLIISLQCLDGFFLIAIVFTNGFDTFIEASKLELLMELDCKFVDVNLVDGAVRQDTLDLEADWLSKGLAVRATEGNADLVDLVVISNNVVSHGQRDREGGK